MTILKRIDDVVREDQRTPYPEKVFQFGEGNFLRAFVDWMIDKLNKAGEFGGSVVLCQPIPQGMAAQINAQKGVYTVLMRGVENGEVVEKADIVTSVSRCINPYEEYGELLKIARSPELRVIVSNTTEAGIAYHAGDSAADTPPVSYPAKLAALLYERYKAFGGSGEAGLLILPVELIERNGDNLKRIVMRYAEEWHLPAEAIDWIDRNVCFANTLVDRIVTGYPRGEIDGITEKLGYRDDILVTCEPFHAWIIEAPQKWAALLPFDRVGLHVVWTGDMTPYRTRKVRILNGAHTVSVLAAFLAGHDIVLEMMEDPTFERLLKSVLWNEIIPNISLPKAELEDFAGAVLERFANPFIRHRLLDISLNSVSKFKARCLDSLLDDTARTGRVPPILCFGLAALIAFYKGSMKDGRYYGSRNGEPYEIRDDADVLAFFAQAWQEGHAAKAVLANRRLWGIDLTETAGLLDAVEQNLRNIEKLGMKNAVGGLMETL